MTKNTKTPNQTNPDSRKISPTAARRIGAVGASLAILAPGVALAKKANPNKVNLEAPISTQQKQLDREMRAGDTFTVLNGQMNTHEHGKLVSVSFPLANVENTAPSLDHPLLENATVGTLDQHSKQPKSILKRVNDEETGFDMNAGKPILRVRFAEDQDGQVDTGTVIVVDGSHSRILRDPTGHPAAVGAPIMPSKVTR